MRFLAFAIFSAGFLAASGAFAQMPSNRSQGDVCQSEAEQLYRGLRNLEERMKMKRAHIAKCRAEKGIKRRPG